MASTVPGSSWLLSFVTVNPAALNILSEATSVAGMDRYSFASLATDGNLSSFTFHQAIGSAKRTGSDI